MKIIHKGSTRLFGISNQTDKKRHLRIWDGNITVMSLVLWPGMAWHGSMYFANDLRISGKGSRGFVFYRNVIKWE